MIGTIYIRIIVGCGESQKLEIMNKVYKDIKGVKYLYWQGYYWLAIKEIKHDCGRKLTVYKKFRLWKGELLEISQGYRMCPSCTVSY